MFEDYTICPYPGLRSFNEDESIYFKGRDHHTIEVIQLLQKNKFLMVTGASGDGKSSLVFGGLIPNAKAGFFKARYNNWKVAHFRPERDPLINLSKSLADALKISNASIVETELERGYSSLVELYKNSDFFESDAPDTIENKRSSHANLLIIVDQFEEIFTNPENYVRGVPSHQAQVTINLLLETAKISFRDDLPIFVVFTMRSDYIGQCTAFRGLPEHIGFSQFFVPRLKRKELKQVVQEPAKLSGGSISNRLVERMLFDLEEGVDQLPVLQHALNQVWLAANNGTAEMDLIHYAKVGGMSPNELPDDNVQEYHKWFTALPDWKKKLFENPSLNKILDIHADVLYNSVWEYYNKKNPQQPISKKEGKFIIAMTFAGLTKIDDSRAVRNRMSLQEITDIINKHDFDTSLVGEVINYFREPGNTFVHPFINEELEETRKLEESSVLDITHEALIRNWNRLNRWVEKESEYYEVYKDLKKQVDRWVKNNRSKRYLLPIGPLVYFEKWFDECNPNKHWISRYIDSSDKNTKKINEAESILDNIKQLLNRSKNNLIVTRTFMKYGSTRIATFCAILFVVFLSSFYYIDAERKQNEQVLLTISDKSTELILHPEVDIFNKGLYMIYNERLRKGSIFEKLSGLPNIENRIEIANNTYLALLVLDRKNKLSIKTELINYIRSELPILTDDNSTKAFKLKQYNDFAFSLAYDWYFNTNELLKETRTDIVKELFPFVLELLNAHDADTKPIELNTAIDHILNIGLSEEQIQKLMSYMSPLYGEQGKSNFKYYYPLNASIAFYAVNVKHNGGYQVLASLYASLGDYEGTKNCIDSLIKHNSDYFQRLNSTSGHSIIGYFEKYGHEELTDRMINYMSEQRGIDKAQFYKELHDRSGYIKNIEMVKFFNKFYYNNILTSLTNQNYLHLAELWNNSIRQSGKTNDEINFEMALSLKQQACNLYKLSVDKGQKINKQELFGLFEQAVQYYQLVSDEYLDQYANTTHRYWTDGSRRQNSLRRAMFLYPDHYVDGYYSSSYSSPIFVDYLLNSVQIQKLYKSPNDLEYFNNWLANYLEIFPYGIENSRNTIDLPYQLLDELLVVIENHPDKSGFDKSLLQLLVANNSFENGKIDKALELFRSIDLVQLSVTATRWEYLNMTAIYNEIVDLSIHLYQNGSKGSAAQIIDLLPDANHQIPAYCALANAVYESSISNEVFTVLDSIFSKRQHVDDRTLGALDYRNYLLSTLGKIGGSQMNAIAEKILSDMPEFKKSNGIVRYVTGQANEGNFYNAFRSISSDLSMTDELLCYTIILAEGMAQSEIAKEGWEEFDKSYNSYSTYIVFNANF